MSTELDPKTLRDVDLNLLLVLSVLLRERNVSRAARKLHIGQSGMSGALARLRRTFDDPLLVRVSRRLEPTARALELQPQVDAALSTLSRALGSRATFDPKTCARTFTLGVTDDIELLYAAPIARTLMSAAPRARLVLRPVDTYAVRATLDEGSADACITVNYDNPTWHRTTDLYAQSFRCLWSPRQLPGWRRLTLERYVSQPHVLVTFRGDLSGLVDTALSARGLERRVVVGVSRFAALPALLDAQPLITTIPGPIAERFARTHRFVIAEPPLPLPDRSLRLVYRTHDEDLAELAWFRGLVARTLKTERERLATLALKRSVIGNADDASMKANRRR
ncbi:MAG: LysR substrate-binding domain-containing protein [Polyangiaceae bacterium]